MGIYSSNLTLSFTSLLPHYTTNSLDKGWQNVIFLQFQLVPISNVISSTKCLFVCTFSFFSFANSFNVKLDLTETCILRDNKKKCKYF